MDKKANGDTKLFFMMGLIVGLFVGAVIGLASRNLVGGIFLGGGYRVCFRVSGKLLLTFLNCCSGLHSPFIV